MGCKWVCKVKYLSEGSLDKFKARLVVKGYTQAEGHDYHNTFSLVAKMATVRTVLAFAAIKNLDIHQWTSIMLFFFHGDLPEEVYMELPKGHPLHGTNFVCKLNKSIYGLKQASHLWFEKMASVLLTFGFTQIVTDYSLFVYKTDDIFVAVLVYVNDILLTGDAMSLFRMSKLLFIIFSQ